MKSPGFRAYTIGYLIFLYAPIILLPMFAFNDSKVIAFPLQGFTTNWFREMWADTTLWNAVRNSAIISISVAVISTTLGLFAARASTRFRVSGQGRHHGPDHAATGSAGNDRGDVDAGGLACHRD